MVSIIPHSYTYQTPAFKGQTKKAKLEHPKDGTISVTNKKGDEYKIEYSGGRMKKVLKKRRILQTVLLLQTKNASFNLRFSHF